MTKCKGCKDKQARVVTVDLSGRAYKDDFKAADADSWELKKGIQIEAEHTDDPATAKKIALDHIAEIPDYYTRLVKMEKEAGVNL